MEKNRILIVDDESSILITLKEIFTVCGFEVFTALNGSQALETLKKEAIPVIITDIQMAGINGIELCNKIREFDKISVIIAMTGFTKFFELTDCREAGFDDYISKPFDSVEIVEIVNHSLLKVDRWEKLFNKSAKSIRVK